MCLKQEGHWSSVQMNEFVLLSSKPTHLRRLPVCAASAYQDTLILSQDHLLFSSSTESEETDASFADDCLACMCED